MNMIFNDNTLYVDVLGEINKEKIGTLKSRIFDIADEYSIGSIILNYDKNTNESAELLNALVTEYKEKYNENITLR